jgi:hypothetical protein
VLGGPTSAEPPAGGRGTGERHLSSGPGNRLRQRLGDLACVHDSRSDVGHLAEPDVVDPAHRIRDQHRAEVPLTGLVESRARAVRKVAADEDERFHTM